MTTTTETTIRELDQAMRVWEAAGNKAETAREALRRVSTRDSQYSQLIAELAAAECREEDAMIDYRKVARRFRALCRS